MRRMRTWQLPSGSNRTGSEATASEAAAASITAARISATDRTAEVSRADRGRDPALPPPGQVLTSPPTWWSWTAAGWRSAQGRTRSGRARSVTGAPSASTRSGCGRCWAGRGCAAFAAGSSAWPLRRDRWGRRRQRGRSATRWLRPPPAHRSAADSGTRSWRGGATSAVLCWCWCFPADICWCRCRCSAAAAWHLLWQCDVCWCNITEVCFETPNKVLDTHRLRTVAKLTVIYRAMAIVFDWLKRMYVTGFFIWTVEFKVAIKGLQIYITDRADEMIWKRGLQNWRRSVAKHGDRSQILQAEFPNNFVRLRSVRCFLHAAMPGGIFAKCLLNFGLRPTANSRPAGYVITASQ